MLRKRNTAKSKNKRTVYEQEIAAIAAKGEQLDLPHSVSFEQKETIATDEEHPMKKGKIIWTKHKTPTSVMKETLLEIEKRRVKRTSLEAKKKDQREQRREERHQEKIALLKEMMTTQPRFLQ